MLFKLSAIVHHIILLSRLGFNFRVQVRNQFYSVDTSKILQCHTICCSRTICRDTGSLMKVNIFLHMGIRHIVRLS